MQGMILVGLSCDFRRTGTSALPQAVLIFGVLDFHIRADTLE